MLVTEPSRLWSKAESMKRLSRFEWVQENHRCWERRAPAAQLPENHKGTHTGQKVMVGSVLLFQGTSKLKEKETETTVLKHAGNSLRTEC